MNILKRLFLLQLIIVVVLTIIFYGEAWGTFWLLITRDPLHFPVDELGFLLRETLPFWLIGASVYILWPLNLFFSKWQAKRKHVLTEEEIEWQNKLAEIARKKREDAQAGKKDS